MNLVSSCSKISVPITKGQKNYSLQEQSAHSGLDFFEKTKLTWFINRLLGH